MPARILSRRLRRCFLLRPPLARLPDGRPLPPPGGPLRPPPAGRPDCPPEDDAAARDAVVRARPPLAGRRAPPPEPPPPVLRVRAGGGRRTDPARGATGEVSSWDGTRNPSLTGVCRQVIVGEPVYRSQPCCCERGVFSCASAGGPSPAVPGWGCCDGRARRDGGLPGCGVYSVATRRRPLRG